MWGIFGDLPGGEKNLADCEKAWLDVFWVICRMDDSYRYVTNDRRILKNFRSEWRQEFPSLLESVSSLSVVQWCMLSLGHKKQIFFIFNTFLCMCINPLYFKNGSPFFEKIKNHHINTKLHPSPPTWPYNRWDHRQLRSLSITGQIPGCVLISLCAEG